jgi:hypothetical protein
MDHSRRPTADYQYVTKGALSILYPNLSYDF